MSMDHGGEPIAAERRPARQRLEQQAPERVDVGSVIAVASGEPLRRHVGERPDRCPRRGERCRGRADGAGDAEVRDVDEPAVTGSLAVTGSARHDQHVAGFDAPVHQPLGVSGVQCRGDLRHDVDGVGGRQRPALRERPPRSRPSTNRMSMKSRPSIAP
jgi:hypothetical protein